MPPQNFVAKFRFLALVDTVLMLLLMYAILQALGFSFWNSIAGMLLYAGVFWTLKFSFFSSVYIDHMTQVVWLLIIWIMVKKWWYLLPILVFGAFFQKESVVAIVPLIMLYFLHQKGWKWWPLYLTGFLLLAASIIPYFILKNNIHPLNESSSIFKAFEGNWGMYKERTGYFKILLAAFGSGVGIFPLILISRFRWLLGYLRQHPYWIVMLLIGGVMIFGGLDKARLMIYILPTLTILCIAAFADLQQKMAPFRYWTLVTVTILLNSYLGGWFMWGFESFEQYLNLFVPVYGPSEGDVGISRLLFVGGLYAVASIVLRWNWEGAESKKSSKR